MLVHFVECRDRHGWYRYAMTFPSPYSAEQFAKSRRAMNHTVRVVDEETHSKPASGGVVTQEQWDLKQHYARRLVIPVDVALGGPPPGASVD